MRTVSPTRALAVHDPIAIGVVRRRVKRPIGS